MVHFVLLPIKGSHIAALLFEAFEKSVDVLGISQLSDLCQKSLWKFRHFLASRNVVQWIDFESLKQRMADGLVDCESDFGF